MTTLDKIWWWLGYQRIVRVNYEPPNWLIKEVEPGVFTRPKHAYKTEIVLQYPFMWRLRLLFSGKTQVVTVVWTENEAIILGDTVTWVVLPPMDPVSPDLAV